MRSQEAPGFSKTQQGPLFFAFVGQHRWSKKFENRKWCLSLLRKLSVFAPALHKFSDMI